MQPALSHLRTGALGVAERSVRQDAVGGSPAFALLDAGGHRVQTVCHQG